MGAITLTGVTKTFDDFTAIAGVDLTVGDGEFVVFVGPSGCGKSTLLRLIAGLEDVSAGQVAIDGVDATAMPPVQWFNPNLAHAANEINALPKLISAGDICLADHNEVAFRLTFDYVAGDGDDAFCTISHDIMQTIQAKPESKATPKPGKERKAETLWREKASRFLIASRFSTTSSRLLALHSEKPARGSGYIAATVNTPEQEKSFAAFLNSSFGAIQMLHRRTKTLTYPAYEAQHLKTLMLPDPATADLAPLLEAFEAVKDTPLQPRPGPRHHRPMARMAE